MKKFLFIVIFILVSCVKEEGIGDGIYSDYEMIFNEVEVRVIDGQEYSFSSDLIEDHYLIVLDEDSGSVIAKELFIPVLGINTKNIYTKALPKKTLKLILSNSLGEQTTNIIIE